MKNYQSEKFLLLKLLLLFKLPVTKTIFTTFSGCRKTNEKWIIGVIQNHFFNNVIICAVAFQKLISSLKGDGNFSILLHFE